VIGHRTLILPPPISKFYTMNSMTMKRSAANNDDATTDDDAIIGKRSKVDEEACRDNNEEHDIASSNNSQAPHEPSSGSEIIASATLSPPLEIAASEFPGTVGGGVATSSSTELAATGGNGGAEAQPSTAVERGAASASSKETHLPAQCSLADDSATGESLSQAAAPHIGHTLDNIEDIDILEYSRDNTGSLTFPEKVCIKGIKKPLFFVTLLSYIDKATSNESSFFSLSVVAFVFPTSSS
jgi:hypothetical protein